MFVRHMPLRLGQRWRACRGCGNRETARLRMGGQPTGRAITQQPRLGTLIKFGKGRKPQVTGVTEETCT